MPTCARPVLRSALFILTVLPMLAAAPPTPSRPAFQPVGDLPGGRVQSEALGVSDDGRVVFGESASGFSGDGAEGFIWTEVGGLEPLGSAFPPPIKSQPRGCTPGCRVLVGQSISPQGQPIATLWEGHESPRSLGDLPGGGAASGALAVSNDGSLVAGWAWSAAGFEAVRWHRGGAAEPLGDLAGGNVQSAIAAISRDQKILAGTGTTAAGQEITLWTADGIRGLGDLPGGNLASEPFAMTPRADVIVGRGASPGCMQAVRWTEADGLEGLGDLPGGACESIALGVSDDGGVVVGYGTGPAGQEAFVWTRAGGLESLRARLIAAGVPGLAGWRLLVANGVSADGRVIVGGGTNPVGAPEGWIVRMAPGGAAGAP